MIFVFESNLAGRHNAGTANYACLYCGATSGKGTGPQGWSYAIPTKGMKLEALDKETIRYYVDKFIEFARINTPLSFQVTRIGCELAGYTDAEIAPLFQNAGPNCYFDECWRPYLPNKKFWGTYT